MCRNVHQSSTYDQGQRMKSERRHWHAHYWIRMPRSRWDKDTAYYCIFWKPSLKQAFPRADLSSMAPRAGLAVLSLLLCSHAAQAAGHIPRMLMLQCRNGVPAADNCSQAGAGLTAQTFSEPDIFDLCRVGGGVLGLQQATHACVSTEGRPLL
jgi:hypothetical protein